MKDLISYYELLTIIKDCEQIWEYPKVYWHNNYRDKVLYIPTFDSVSGDLEGYHIKNRNLENEDIRYWLSECMLESSMFDKCIEIAKQDITINEEDKKIEKLDQRTDTGLFGSMVKDEIEVANTINKQANYLSDIVSKINEIIDYLEENK